MKVSANKAGFKPVAKKPAEKKPRTLTDARRDKQIDTAFKQNNEAMLHMAEAVQVTNKALIESMKEEKPKKWDIKISRGKNGLIESLTCTEIK